MSQPYQEGFRAGRYNPETRCPYEHASYDFEEWHRGFAVGRNERLSIM